MRRGQIVPINYPLLDGHCLYCQAIVPADDDHAERSFGRSWRLRCTDCRDRGANHAEHLDRLVMRALRGK